MADKNKTGGIGLPALAFILVVLGLLAGPLGFASAEKPPKAEDVVERSILAYGGRPALQAIQRNGVLRALIKFHTPEGLREGKSVTRFIRKSKLAEDLLMLELELPGTRYLIGFDGKETWEMQDGQIIEPNPENVAAFRNAHEHSYEALLRYKESNAKIEYAGTNKLGTFDMDLIDLISPEGARTRYEISRKFYHILYLNYEEAPRPGAAPVKYRLNFKNFQQIQGTVLPYETRVFQDGKLIEERKIVESAFNVQLEEKAFKAENAGKPTEAAVKQ
jgi:hypothetical protein